MRNIAWLWRPLLAITVHEDLARIEGVPVTAADLTRYEVRWRPPVEVAWLGRRVLTRAGRAVPVTLHRLP